MKTILVATDYSRCAHNALEYAAALAKGLRARLVIFHAISLPGPPAVTSLFVPGIDGQLQEHKHRLQALGNRISKAYGLEVDCTTSTELLTDGLKREIKKQGAGLLVLGKTGGSYLPNLVGSVSTTILNTAGIPVLLVPEESAFRGLHHILFACNYAYLSKQTQLESINILATAFKAQVQILHVEREDVLEAGKKVLSHQKAPNLADVFAGTRHTYRYLFNNSIPKGIERGIEEFRADMVVLVPHRPGFWESLIHSSVTHKLARHTHVPLLALPEVFKRGGGVRKVSKPAAVHL